MSGITNLLELDLLLQQLDSEGKLTAETKSNLTQLINEANLNGNTNTASILQQFQQIVENGELNKTDYNDEYNESTQEVNSTYFNYYKWLIITIIVFIIAIILLYTIFEVS